MSQLKVTHTQAHSLGDGPSFEQSIPYEQGDQGGTVQFAVICTNLPVGTQVSFSSDKPGTTPPLELPPTVITISPTFITGMVCQVPANYSCNITYKVNMSQQPPQGASINFQAALIQ